MKNYLVGFLLSVFFHLGVVALVINSDSKQLPKPVELEEIALSLSMFEETVTKQTPEEESAEPVVLPEVAEKNFQEQVNQGAIVSAVVAAPIVRKVVGTSIQKKSLKPVLKAEPKTKPVAKQWLKKEVSIKKVTTKKVMKDTVKSAVKKEIKRPVKTRSKRIVSKPKKAVPKEIVKKRPVRPKSVREPNPQAKPRVAQKTIPKGVERIPAKSNHAVGAVAPNAKPLPKTAVKSRSTPKPANNSAQLKRVENNYKNRLRQLIAKKKRYPQRAKRRGKQGTVYMSFVILANGQIIQVRAVKSSGHALLDKASIKTIQSISGLLPIPKELKRSQWQISIPVTYKLR